MKAPSGKEAPLQNKEPKIWTKSCWMRSCNYLHSKQSIQMCEGREVHFVTKPLQESVIQALLVMENLQKIIEMLKLNKNRERGIEKSAVTINVRNLLIHHVTKIRILQN